MFMVNVGKYTIHGSYGFCARIENEICHTYLSPSIVLSDPILFVSKLSHPSMILSHPFQRLAPKTSGFSRWLSYWNGVMFTQRLRPWNISLHFMMNFPSKCLVFICQSHGAAYANSQPPGSVFGEFPGNQKIPTTEITWGSSDLGGRIPPLVRNRLMHVKEVTWSPVRGRVPGCLDMVGWSTLCL